MKLCNANPEMSQADGDVTTTSAGLDMNMGASHHKIDVNDPLIKKTRRRHMIRHLKGKRGESGISSSQEFSKGVNGRSSREIVSACRSSTTISSVDPVILISSNSSIVFSLHRVNSIISSLISALQFFISVSNIIRHLHQ